MRANIRKLIAILMLWVASLGTAIAQKDTLKVGIHPVPPFIMEDVEGSYEGLAMELWKEVSEKAGIYPEYTVFSDDIGIIRALDYGEIDLSINPLVNTATRTRNFEVTQPFYISQLGVAITTSSQSQFQIFLNNFFSLQFLEVNVLLLLILLLFGTFLWLMERRHNKYQFRPGILGMMDGLWWAAVTMTTVGYGDKAPKTTAGKTIAIIWMFTAVIIISSFTATIASTLTVNSLEARIQSLADLKVVERIGVVGASDAQDFLRENQMNPFETYRTTLQALHALARKDINVLVHDRITMEFLIRESKLESNVQLLPMGFDSRYRCWMMPKSHPRFEEINQLLMESLASRSWKEALNKFQSQ